MSGYDIIGDIHGEADALEGLLGKLGYIQQAGVWKHPGRLAVFVGDFIDRGRREVDTVNIVRRMMDAGNAFAVIGNHEFNAIGWLEGWRDREKGMDQHRAFLADVGEFSDLHREMVGWFKTLPLWLELDGINVIHACWHQGFMDWLKPQVGEDRVLKDDLLEAAFSKPTSKKEIDTPAPSPYKSVDAFLKGLEVTLPDGVRVYDHQGQARDRVRTRWWDPDAITLDLAALLETGEAGELPADPIPGHKQLGYTADKPLFFGHYWFSGVPAPLGPKVACLDYSVAKGGKLCAYRWEGEESLTADNFVWVE